jgi:hypothetical protein
MKLQNVRLLPIIIVILTLGCVAIAEVYDARINNKEILTPASADAPRINGPKVYGARPGRKFIYRIPCQGKRPISFKVEGLPAGLKLDTKKGIITGKVPVKKGDYAMTFTAKNAHGTDSRPFTLVIGDKIALTPPTGWNSWGGHMVTVSDAVMRTAADVFDEKGLADVGFQYIGIDDCWMRLTRQMYEERKERVRKKHEAYDYEETGTIGLIRDEDGNIQPNDKFPDMKAMTDYIHSKGLKAGIYSGPGPKTCQDWAGSYGHERADAAQYAAWGFDLLKYDLCSGRIVLAEMKKKNKGYTQADFWKPMVEYLAEQDRDILYNLCQYGREKPWTWAPSIGIQTWRIGGDLNHNVDNYFKNALRIATELREFSKPGQWNDPDFMYIHRIRYPSKMGEDSREIPLDTNQRYQYVTLWSIICAPYFFSCDIENIDDFTIGLLANADVVNINQDELGHVAEVIGNGDTTETVMVKKLADGSRVLAIFNRKANEEAIINATWDEIDISGRQTVYDLWRQKDVGSYDDGITVKLSPNGVGLFRLSPLRLSEKRDIKINPTINKNKKTPKGKAAGLTIPTVDKKDIICFAPYTVQNNIMKMTAQLYPLDDDDSRTVRLEIKKGWSWKQIATSTVDESDYGIGDGAQRWTASFRVENWDSKKNWDYRLAHGKSCYYTGRIRKDPVDKETIVVAAFTGNSNRDRGQKADIIANIKAHDPDLLFFSGDQSYDHKKHLAAWLLFGRQFGEIIRDRPTVCIPDDHDIGQGNLWGAGGKVSKTAAGHDGGYFHPVQYVKSVENAQTGNLPDPYDPTPILRGIGVYYTSLNVGGVDFAIIEDRKFKSGPAGLVPKMGPRPDHINDPNYDPKTVDVAGAKLLGERQLKFLSEWGKDWRGVEMKAVLSQTVFANAAHIHRGQRLIADMDSNGWPQTGRNKAIDAIRKSYALMIGGDQHLATVIHHGIDEFNDAGFSFCVPSIVNFYPRQWIPLAKGIDPVTNALEHTGKYLDGFGNHLTMYAYANPYEGKLNYPKWREKGHWGKLAAGHGIIRFNKKTRKITMECWPRGVDVTKKDAKQFPGWPITINQLDNFGKKAVAYLPTIKVSGMTMPVIQVIDESSKQVVYTLRIKGDQFRPKVFAKGSYTVIVGDQQNKVKKLKGLKSLAAEDTKIIKVAF